MTLAFIYLAIGFILANIGHYLTRNRSSHRSPVKFNFKFWLRDNYIKLIHSIVVAVGLCVLANLHPSMTTVALRHVPFLPETFEWLPIYTVFIGLFPDAILAFLKSKWRIVQPKKATDSTGKVYDRK